MSSAPSPAHRALHGHRRARLPWGLLLALSLALLLAAAAAANAAPATMRLLDSSPTLGQQVTVQTPDGGSFADDPGRSLLSVVPTGGGALTTSGWCIDPTRLIDEGVDYPVDLTSAAADPALATPAAQEAAWLISQADALIAASPQPGREAAAIQVAVWQLTGQAANMRDVTDDPSLNLLTGSLRAMAAGRAPATAIAVEAPAGPVTAGEAVPLAITGTPGTAVSLEASGAALSSAAVTLDDAGRAAVVVTPSAPGTAVVTARAEGALLWRAAHLPQAQTPQDMAYVTPVPLSATATLTVVAPAVVPPVVTPPVTPAAIVPARLRLVKRAPRAAVRGRVIAYRLTVRNVSRQIARSVVIRDRLPAGTVLVRRPSRARIVRGTVIWRIGDLAPGARRSVGLRVRTLASARARVRNVATARASNAALVRARALTGLRAPARVAPAVAPAVTG